MDFSIEETQKAVVAFEEEISRKLRGFQMKYRVDIVAIKEDREPNAPLGLLNGIKLFIE